MKRKSSPMWEFLLSKGVLETGDEEAIAQAKKEWRRVYDTRYKAELRKRRCQHVVSLTPEEQEKIKRGARDVNMTIAEFLKKGTLAYIGQTYVIDVSTMRSIEALLIRSLSALEEISKGGSKKGWFARDRSLDDAKEAVMKLKADMNKQMSKPDLLVSAIKNNPAMWQDILNLINDLKNSGS